MKTITENDNRVHREFTYQEFVDFAENRKESEQSKSVGENGSRDTENPKWSGTENFKEALELARYGWDAQLQQIPLKDGVLDGTGIIYEPTIAGSAVNVGAYVQGLPENMYNMREMREYNLEALTIYCRLNFSYGNSGEKSLKFTRSMLDLVNHYQSHYDVKIVGVFNSEFSRKEVDYRVDVIIKEHGERFVLNNIAFSLHTSFFRRLYFSVLESENHIQSGYGVPYNHKKIADELIKEIGTSKAIISPSLADLSNGNFRIEQATKINL